jgi:hypothetical protein
LNALGSFSFSGNHAMQTILVVFQLLQLLRRHWLLAAGRKHAIEFIHVYEVLLLQELQIHSTLCLLIPSVKNVRHEVSMIAGTQYEEEYPSAFLQRFLQLNSQSIL